MHKSALFIASMALLLAATQSLHADGVIRNGIDAISGGRGGVNIASADNGAIILDNPAGMINIAGLGLAEVGLDMLVTDLAYSDAQNSVDASNNPYPLPYASFIRTTESGTWAWGLGVFAPAGFGAEYDLVNTTVTPLQSQFHYKSFGAVGKLAPAVACLVFERLSVGANLTFAASHLEIEGPFFLQTGPLAGTPTVLDLQASGGTLTYSIGLQYELSDDTMLGLTYNSQTKLRLDGNANVRVEVIPLGQSYFDADVRVAFPRSLGAGINHALRADRRVMADVIWYNWSDAFDQVDLTLTGPDNPVFAAVIGNQVSDSFPLRWRDSVSVRLGCEQMLTDDQKVRLGYVYHRNPIPDPFLTPFIPATLEHTVTAGYEKQFERVSLNLAYQFSFGPDRFVGTSSILGGDFSNSRLDVSAHFAMLSLLWRW